MARHTWSVLCSRSVLDAETNNMTLVEVIEQINIVIPPSPPPAEGRGLAPMSLELVSLWMRDNLDVPERAQSRIRILLPNGTEAASMSNDVDLSTFARARLRGRMQGVPIENNVGGTYEFVVEKKEGDSWRQVASVPLQVVIGIGPVDAKPPTRLN